jgi:hypothetical protein
MVQVIPLQALPSQSPEVQLGNQICQINVYQKLGAMYLDLYVNNALIIGGVICQNLNRIVRDLYLGFVGDVCFIDNQGDTDPVYTGLGTRYSLLYLTPSDLPPGVG